MNIFFSTNGINALDFEKTFSYIEPFGGKVGVEIFPCFHVNGYKELFEKCHARLRDYPISCHAPYYESEYSAPIGTASYIRSMELLDLTLNAVADLNTRYMVFHHNNCSFDPSEKETMRNDATKNYSLIKECCGKYNIPLVVENAGVKSHQNMLLDEQEFIDACRALSCPVLIDIGHANANGWDICHVIDTLKDQIISYHVHNNDGYEDGHRRIFDGTLDFEKFLAHYKKVTPDADIVVEYCPEAAADVAGVQEDITYLLNALER